jgi:hypothetical protein
MSGFEDPAADRNRAPVIVSLPSGGEALEGGGEVLQRQVIGCCGVHEVFGWIDVEGRVEGVPLTWYRRWLQVRGPSGDTWIRWFASGSRLTWQERLR